MSFFVALDAFNLFDWIKLRASKLKYKSIGEAFSDAKFRERINKELAGMEVVVNYGIKRKYKYV